MKRPEPYAVPGTPEHAALIAQLRSVRAAAAAHKPLIIEIPIETRSEANTHEHWRGRANRAVHQRTSVRVSLYEADFGGIRKHRPLVVVLTRISPRELDSDNLVGAMKAPRDGVADFLGSDDRNPEIAWHVTQTRGVAGVRVLVRPRDARDDAFDVALRAVIG